IPFVRGRIVRPERRQRLPEVGEGAVVELHARSADRGLPVLVGLVGKCLGHAPLGFGHADVLLLRQRLGLLGDELAFFRVQYEAWRCLRNQGRFRP
ncbi:hypothetical protein, partial [Pseudomonas palmensis]|uniref:hypothetical protein n=1 Tax=Pseudomonas palmensis TaxID=2815362 RepID=UPI001AE4C516